jgi:peptidoglycan/LPS O-acetylase OafA/YrhL
MSESLALKDHYRSDIQGLRGLAVLLVVVYHTGFAIPGGFVGVDMFFVISGFVITQVLMREVELTGKVSLKDFYSRRARRLIPALSLVMVFTILVSIVTMSPFGEQQQIFKTAIASVFFGGNIHLFAMNSYDALTSNPLRHLWSLGVEEQFYWVYPMFFIGLMKFSSFRLDSKRIRVCLWVVSLCSFLIGLALTNGFEFGYREGTEIERQFGFLSKIGFIPGKDWPTKFAFFGAPARFWEILVGAILAFTVQKFKDHSKLLSTGLAFLGLALVAWASLTFDAATKFPGHLALLPVVGTALLILFNQNVRVLNKFFGSKRLVYLGDISYSLYLWHWPLIVFAKAIWPNSSSAVLIAAATVSLVPADLSYRLVESRFRGRTDKSKSHKTLVIGLLAVTPLFVSIVANRAANTGLGLPVPWGSVQDWKENDVTSLEGCLFGTRDFVGDCLFAVEEPKFRMMLLGDSNAGAAGESVIAASEQSGGDVIISHEAGCPFVPQIKRDGCASLNFQRLKFLERSRPSFVMLIASDMKYVRALSLDIYLDYLKESLDLLSELKIPVIVLGPIPDCYFPLTLYGKYSGQIFECGLDISDQSVRNSLLIKSKALTLSVDENVFIDPTDVVCPMSKCRAKREIGWIFSDFNHLSPTGSKLLTPLYVEAIQKVLATQRP